MARLLLDRLTKRFGTHAAVHDVTLDVRDGELMCLLGPSGCGKTTTLRMIGGFVTPDAGDIQIDGTSIVTMPPERRPTAMVFQRYNLWPHMTVAQNVGFGLRLRRLAHAEIDRRVTQALELVGLPQADRKFPHQLSGGEQQRVAVARALVLQPKLLLLDEPFSNLDARLRVRMREEVKQLQRTVGITTVFVTHDQEEALTIADRIAVMHQGVLQQVDTPAALYAYPRTLFVADFIGTMNLIGARAHAAPAGTMLSAGPWHLPVAGTRWSEGSEVTVAVRPEDVVMAADGVELEVRRVVNLGHYLQAVLWCAEIGEIRMFTDKGAALGEGQRVAVRPARALAFHGSELVEIGGPMHPAVASSAERR